MARPRKNLNEALSLVVKDLIESNQSPSDVGAIVGCLGEDSTKWLEDLKKECTSIDEFIDIARQRADIALVAAAMKEALGYEYEEIDQNYIKVPDGYDERGNPRMRDCEGSRKVKKKRHRGNEALLKFILKNRLPAYFQDVSKVEVNKKSIEIKEVAAKEIQEFARGFLTSLTDDDKKETK